MLIIGLTGGMGSGKSSVARWFEQRKVPVLDADKIVHRLLAEDRETIKAVAREFGREVVAEDGSINRKVLGKIVFADSFTRKRLEKIVHPCVLRTMLLEEKRLAKKGIKLSLWDVPLLFEAGFEKYVHEVWVVWVPQDVQIARVKERDKLSEVEIKARLEAQIPLEEKVKQADVVIDNSGTWLETENQLEAEWVRIIRKAGL